MAHKIIRMTDDSFIDLMTESITRTLNEGATWDGVKKGLKYFSDRVIHGDGPYKLSNGSADAETLRKMDKHFGEKKTMDLDQYNKIRGRESQENSENSSDSTGSNDSSTSTESNDSSTI